MPVLCLIVWNISGNSAKDLSKRDSCIRPGRSHQRCYILFLQCRFDIFVLSFSNSIIILLIFSCIDNNVNNIRHVWVKCSTNINTAIFSWYLSLRCHLSLWHYFKYQISDLLSLVLTQSVVYCNQLFSFALCFIYSSVYYICYDIFLIIKILQKIQTLVFSRLTALLDMCLSSEPSLMTSYCNLQLWLLR